jgi:diguanylate cyclase (GGDEF)-like protein/PAS domain S-box-containing protein
LYLAFHRKDRFGGRSWVEIVSLFAVLGAVTFALFWQSRFPFLFLVLPILLWLELRLRLEGSALGLLLVSLLGGLLASAGRGPTNLIRTESIPERDLVFQMFIGVSMLLLYLVEVRLSESERLRANVEESERRFRLLAEASSDIIILSDLDNRRRYASPAITEVLGWMPEEAVARSFREAAHPDDLQAVERLFRDCLNGAPAESLEYRACRADGSYAWLEIKPRLYCDASTGQPAGFVTVARDISRRKLEEAEEHKAFETMEHLASSDPLTGIANRRHFDTTIENEWLRAARERTSLSVLLLDVDFFKVYNDLNGHLIGDECLRQIVATILPVVSRPADLLARYGGEEFIVVLPSTDAAGARQMAEWIRDAVESARLPHPGNLPYGVITVSVGCATMVPRPEITHLHLLEAADRALYRAKSQGRNCVQVAEVQPGTGTVLMIR